MAVGPEIAKRLGQLAGEADEAFSLPPDGLVLWRGQAAGAISGGAPFAPRVRLLGELGNPAARERAARRLEAFLAAEAVRRLGALRRLETAVSEGKIKGLARGLAYRLIEAGGVLDRTTVQAETKALSQVERRMLKGLGVRLGHFTLYLPAMLNPAALSFVQGFADKAWRPPTQVISRLPEPAPSPTALAAFGLRAVGRHAVPVEALERMDDLMRAAKPGQLTDADREALGWSEQETKDILRALGFAPTTKPKAGEAMVWRRRSEKPDLRPIAPSPNSPFSALAALKDKPAPARRPRRRRKAKAANP